jgi:hypothetical protein
MATAVSKYTPQIHADESESYQAVFTVLSSLGTTSPLQLPGCQIHRLPQ